MDGGRQGDERNLLLRAALLLLLLLQDPGHHGGRVVARVPVQGKWRLVAVQGLEAQMAAIGMSKAEIDKLKDVYIPARTVTPATLLQLLPGGEGRQWGKVHLGS